MYILSRSKIDYLPIPRKRSHSQANEKYFGTRGKFNTKFTYKCIESQEPKYALGIKMECELIL